MSEKGLRNLLKVLILMLMEKLIDGNYTATASRAILKTHD